MLIAQAQNDNEKMLVIGLDEENMRKLSNDEPIKRNLGEIVPELSKWTLVILGPEDMARFIAQVAKK